MSWFLLLSSAVPVTVRDVLVFLDVFKFIILDAFYEGVLMEVRVSPDFLHVTKQHHVWAYSQKVLWSDSGISQFFSVPAQNF